MRVFVSLFLFSCLLDSKCLAIPDTIYWEATRLLECKESRSNDLVTIKERLRRNANSALGRGPYSVTFKSDVPPSGDRHDYMSFSRYWWPNPGTTDGLPYIRKDGVVNVEIRQRGDRDQVGMLMEDVETLALAAYIFEDARYAAHSRKLIDTWFIDPATRMNPHLRYGQAVPGRAEGRGVGIIDTRGFIKVLDSVALLESIGEIQKSDLSELRDWFSEYLEWLLSSDLGKDEAARDNNHGSWYLAQVGAYALFVGNQDLARKTAEDVRQNRFSNQFESDGSQPAELVRTQSLHYSFFNLEALSVVARVGEQVGVDLWQPSDVGAMKPGIDFLIPFVSGKQDWAYPQIREYDMSRGTCNLLRMASVRYRDTSYLAPIGKIDVRHPENNYSRLQFHEFAKPQQRQQAEISVSNDPVIQPEYLLPDISEVSVDSVRKLVSTQRAGKAIVQIADGGPLLRETFQRSRRKGFEVRQGTEEIRIIRISQGVVNLIDVIEQVDDQEAISVRDGIVLVRLPIVVNEGAGLIIDGQAVEEVRLSTNRGTFLANGGTLFVIDSKITSWSEEDLSSTTFTSKSDFRPFIASYIRSETFLANSTFIDLGYHAPTSYGLSLSSQPEREQPELFDQWPTGIIVGNEFRGLYYGFYSYEARDVKIVGNTYKDCILYGIDPHDRSTELVIAQNVATGTVERHGIIGSRGISNSFIFDNTSYRNNGSGIMLDRQCTGNVVCNNKVFNNGQGIAVYESPNNIIAKNVVVQNKKSGVRVRNSIDIAVFDNQIVGNGDYGLEASSKRLSDHLKRAQRGDTYDEVVRLAVFNNVVAGNRGGRHEGHAMSRIFYPGPD